MVNIALYMSKMCIYKKLSTVMLDKQILATYQVSEFAFYTTALSFKSSVWQLQPANESVSICIQIRKPTLI